MSGSGAGRGQEMPSTVLVMWLVLCLVALAWPVPAVRAADETAISSAATADRRGLVLSQVLGVRELSGHAGNTGYGGNTGHAGNTAHAGSLGDTGRTGTGTGDRRRTALWGWPLVGTPPVVATFDPPAQRWLPGHRGVDLGGVAGEPVLAVDEGVVTFSGEVAGVGMVSVTHESGLRSTYQPVIGRVPRGERVGRGQALGTLDTTASHCVPGTCLHLGAVRGRDDYVDPLPLLLGAELSLLPVEP